jgi:hypothetical protein
LQANAEQNSSGHKEEWVRLRERDPISSVLSVLLLLSGSFHIRFLKILDLAEAMIAGSGNVMSDKRFLGPTLDITTDTGDIRQGVSRVWTNRKTRLMLTSLDQ